MMKWIVQRVVVGKINSLLEQHRDNVMKVKSTVKIWIARLEKVLAAFKSLLEKLDDNEIDADEIS